MEDNIEASFYKIPESPQFTLLDKVVSVEFYKDGKSKWYRGEVLIYERPSISDGKDGFILVNDPNAPPSERCMPFYSPFSGIKTILFGNDQVIYSNPAVTRYSSPFKSLSNNELFTVKSEGRFFDLQRKKASSE